MRLAAFVLFALVTSGCTSGLQNGGGGGGNPGAAPISTYTPTRHDWASNSPQAVPAGEAFADQFTIEGSPVPVTYRVELLDDSAVDTGFILASDLAEYRQGQTVTGWAAQSNTAGTQQSETLNAGSYAFVIRCRNSFADCDLRYSLWAVY